ncbi:MAG: serine/threonine-protein kinase [Planctomycetota bacterium]
MADPRTRELIELYSHAFSLGPDERDDFLASCDQEVYDSLVALLRAGETGGPGADRVFTEILGELSQEVFRRLEEPHLPQLDGFRIEAVLGSGGASVVYRALQAHPHREVAIKVLRPELVSSSALQRFELEAELLGYLRHPSIAHVYQVGTAKDAEGARPWFAMELVDGEHIDDYARALSIDERLRLFQAVCAAVHYAHQRGIVHRDLKPNNILVTRTGTPKVMDFGIARVRNPDLASDSTTEMGQIMGTLAYMSPEQISGQPEELDLRTDVYSLGVILYETLAGTSPYELRGLPLAEAARRIIEVEPIPLRSPQPDIARDLALIVDRALAKDKERRYGTAADLADDIDRYLTLRPIEARPPTTRYQLRMFMRRHRVAVSTLLLLFASLALGLAGTTAGFVQASRSADVATARTRTLERTTEFQENQLSRIEVATFAADLRQGLFDRARSAWEATAEDPSEEAWEARAAELEDLLTGTDFAGLSLAMLEDHVLQPAVSELDDSFRDEPLVRAGLLQALASVHVSLGLLKSGKVLQDEALAIRRESLGQEHEDTLATLRAWARLRSDLGDHSEAAETLQGLVEVWTERFGSDGELTVWAKVDLCSALRAMGKGEEALALAQEIHATREETLGEGDKETLKAKINLASIHADLDQLPMAKDLLEAAHRTSLQERGADDWLTASAASNLGEVVRRLGDFDEARALQEDALEYRRRAKGERHPETLGSMHNLSLVLLEQGDLGGAAALQERVLEWTRNVHGARHSMTLQALESYASTLHSAGDFKRTQELLEEIYAGYRATLSADHMLTLRAKTHLGAVSKSNGDLLRAQQLLSEAVESLTEQLGEDHRESRSARANLAVTLYARGQVGPAAELLAETLEASTVALGEDHSRVQVLKSNLAFMQRQLGEKEAALRGFQEVHATKLEQFGATDYGTLLAQVNLAETYYAIGDQDEALRLGEEAVQLLPELGDARETLVLATVLVAELQLDRGDREGCAASTGSARAIVDDGVEILEDLRKRLEALEKALDSD